MIQPRAMLTLSQELDRLYPEVFPMEFYRDIFPNGELDHWGDTADERSKNGYCGIFIECTNTLKKDGHTFIKRHTVTDELDAIDGAIWSNHFCFMSPISYIGKQRISKNARILYALAIDLDYLKVSKGKNVGLFDLIHHWDIGHIPKPTYIVASGTGLHLYYLFEEGIPLFPNVVKSLSNYKHELTRKIWNRYVTRAYKEEDIQYESLFQAFRMVGTITKKRSKNERVRAFLVGERVSIEYMNMFVSKENAIDLVYRSKLTLTEAKEKYPDWYERRIVNGEEKKHWTCNRAVYDWWKKRISTEAVVGHRYYCLMMLSIYAIKCDIEREELERDCVELMKKFDKLSVNEDNRFTIKDVLDALQSFEDKQLVTYPINSISNRSGLRIEKNKRNFKPQKWHLEDIREDKARMKRRGQAFKNPEGRPKGSSKERLQVVEWRKSNPYGRKADCIRETGLAKSTVYRWWNED